MKKISKVVNAVSVTSIILGLFSPTATVFADSNDSSVVKTESSSENTIENYEAYDMRHMISMFKLMQLKINLLFLILERSIYQKMC
jgi:hypothetical protein